ncbi:MAG: DNA polymerase III subunit gamma/tau [Patescibacteria group bacterium]|jgi:DNA polymerase-3 subunit gamma/tau
MADNKALYRRWRPQVFADLVGQNHVKQTIINAIKQGHVSHAYLFAGPRGTGKTSLARLVAKALNCLDLKEGEPCGKCANCLALAGGRMIDLIEIDAASHTSVDDVRNLIERVNFTPSVGKYKVYIIDEVHMLSKSAFNALLKTLEEPPAHAIFILATTEVHKLPPTVISRCQYFDFHFLSHAEVTEQLRKIAKQEKVDIDDEALRIIVDNAEGSLRDAISIMDQATSFADGKVDPTTLKDLLGIVDTRLVGELTQALLDKNVVAGINLINETYFKGYDLNQLSKLWLEFLRELLMIKLGNSQLVQKSEDEKMAMAKQAEGFTVSSLVNLLQRLVEAINQYKVASLPQLALEMVLAKSCSETSATTQGKSMSVAVPPIAHPVSNIIEPVAEPSSSLLSPDLSAAVLSAPGSSEIKEKLCELLSAASPSLGAVLKTCQVENPTGKLRIKAPSKFLRDTLEKSTNRELIREQLVKLQVGSLEIEYIAEESLETAAAVAKVFDIM